MQTPAGSFGSHRSTATRLSARATAASPAWSSAGCPQATGPEWVPYEPDPRPDRWQFAVYSDGGMATIIETADVDLWTDTVMRSDGDPVSTEEFRDDCDGNLELTPGTVAAGIGTVVVIVGLVAVIARSELKRNAARRRTVDSFPPRDT